MTLLPTTDLLGRYRPIDGAYDELVEGDEIRGHWTHVAETLNRLGPAELAERTRESRRLLVDDGVTYNVTTGDAERRRDRGCSIRCRWSWPPTSGPPSRPAWPSGPSSSTSCSPTCTAPAGCWPRASSLPRSCTASLGSCGRATASACPGEHQLFHAAFDLGRNGDGSWAVLSDRTHAPSGMGYARANRVVVSRVLPDLYRDADVVRLAPFFREMRAALRRVAPESVDVAPHRRAHARSVERDLLRARVARLLPRLPAGAGLRPAGARRPGVDADPRAPRTRPRDPPAGRRDLLRPARAPPRLHPRRAGPARGLPGRERVGRQHAGLGRAREPRAAPVPAEAVRGAARAAAAPGLGHHVVVRRSGLAPPRARPPRRARPEVRVRPRPQHDAWAGS